MQAGFWSKWLRWRQGVKAQPQLVILGAQKAGTTTLFDMLDGVGPFRGSTTKEVGYFSKDVYFSKGDVWYRSHFNHHASANGIGFEATPEYLYYDFVPSRIRECLPLARFVVLLREPAQRSLSAWNMFQAFNRDQPQVIYDHFIQHANPNAREPLRRLLFASDFPSFESCVESELACMDRNELSPPEPSFVGRGLYVEQIERYLTLFDRSRFVFLEQRELNDPRRVASAIGELMETKLDPGSLKVQVSNRGDYESHSASVDATLARLRAFYQPYNERLFSLIGRTFDW